MDLHPLKKITNKFLAWAIILYVPGAVHSQVTTFQFEAGFYILNVLQLFELCLRLDNCDRDLITMQARPHPYDLARRSAF